MGAGAGRAAWNLITSDPFRFAVYGPFTSWNAKKAAHMAVQGEAAAISTAASPCVLQSSAPTAGRQGPA